MRSRYRALERHPTEEGLMSNRRAGKPTIRKTTQLVNVEEHVERFFVRCVKPTDVN